MATYEYRCPECGILERAHQMGAAPPAEDCADCGTEAPRIMSVPMLGRTPKPKQSAMARAEKSRDEPELARRPASQETPARQVNPKLEQLVGKQQAQHLRSAPHPASVPARH